jgi:hypothetical protein
VQLQQLLILEVVEVEQETHRQQQQETAVAES